jgi:hypothetical protein
VIVFSLKQGKPLEQEFRYGKSGLQYISPKDPIIQYIEPELRPLLGPAALIPLQPGKFRGQARLWLGSESVPTVVLEDLMG